MDENKQLAMGVGIANAITLGSEVIRRLTRTSFTSKVRDHRLTEDAVETLMTERLKKHLKMERV